jgi:FlaG/FlaF family flagellin (archaellin)
MSYVSLVGGSPIAVLSPDGKQYGIPLSLLAVKDGQVDSSKITGPLKTAIGATLDAALGALFLSGAIQAGTASAPVLAMNVKAKVPGATGNTISLTFANVNPDATNPADGTVDVTIAYQDKREGLTIASIGTLLGTPAGGTAPGLVALKAAATELPAALAPVKLGGTPLEYVVPAEDGSGDAFTFTAPGTDPLLADVTVEIKDVAVPAGTFTLIVALSHAATGVKIGDLAGKLGLLVDITAPSGGLAAPAPGTITLSGGSEAQTS